MKITNSTNSSIIADNCSVADNFVSRFFGLMGKRSVAPGSGLLIEPCNSIHMFFMRFPIDAVFLDKNNKVVYICASIKPWRVSRIVGSARSVLELPAGTAAKTSTAVGDVLVFSA
ncbi:MAG: DUF192 domain-containing protein [Clostridiales bacterium]|nr:DUF192 domain-containing protein [Clostridiales bacterium]